MERPKTTAGGRRQELAWFITVPAAALTATLLWPLVRNGQFSREQLITGGLFLAVFILAQAIVLVFEVRRHSFTLLVTEIPLLLALLYLPAPMVVADRLISLILVQTVQRVAFVKRCFNAAIVGLATTVASLIVMANPTQGVGPRTWLVLSAAVVAATTITLVAVVGVISMVQGFPPVKELARTVVSVGTVSAVNITVGLVVLVVLEVEPWSVLLLVGLAGMLGLVYRSYAQFVGQHRSLTELYELTRALGDASRDDTLPDVLLGRVRQLLQAEYATLWLPAQGRYPQLLLSAGVDSPGLLDVDKTPKALREEALAAGKTVMVGAKTGPPALREQLKETGVKDAIVVPLRSGTAVIGSLEVIGRLGDTTQFGASDVRLLETLAAQAAVAVENSRLVDRLRYDAYHDALTSLPNRRRLLALLEEAVKVRAPGEVVAVLFVDIDGLRDVNEALGHAAGDRMVVEVGARLRRYAPAAALVGRLGGDGFAVTLRMPAADEAVTLATELRQALHQPMEVDSVPLDVDVAIGVAVHPDHGMDAGALLRRANLAAQAAKLVATPVLLYHPSLQSRSTHRLGLAADMRRALEYGEVQVHLQPKVALPDRRVVGVECLARWDHPSHGAVLPTDFVAVAEHTGQMARLTEVVLREGLRRARGWIDAGRSLPIAVNLSPRTLIDPTFPNRVAELLAEYRVPAAALTFEITEGIVVREPDRPMATLRRLSELGVRVAVDDFGTGYSSLSYLRRLPVAEVKIDRSFVQGMVTDPGDLAIVRAVVGLAHHFGLVVVAEGVESERSVSLLEELGCDVGQGFLFSRPLPFDRFEAWLANQELTNQDTIGIPDQAFGGGSGAEVRHLRVVP